MLDGLYLFDCAAYGIGEAEASLLDPQQRQLVETTGALACGQRAGGIRKLCGI